MGGKRAFINPLTRSSESELNVPAPESGVDSDAIAGAEAGRGQKRFKKRERAFEETHQRFTTWVDKSLKREFDELAVRTKVSKTALLDEAIAVLLHKQQRKPYTRSAKAE